MVSTVQTLAILAVFAAVIVTVASSVAFAMAFMEWMLPSKDSTAERDAGTAFLAFFLSFVGYFGLP